MDCVVFAERRQSVIDIVQAVGRCLRIPKDRPKKIAKIFIPIIIDKHNNKYNRKSFCNAFEIIEAIKAHDKSLEDEIDKINLSTSVDIPSGGGKIKIKSYNKDINIQNISKNIRLEIAKLNSEKIKVLKKSLVKKIVSSKTEFKIVRMAFPDGKI